MTDDQQSRGPEGLSEDPVVGWLVPDPSQPPPVVLVGLLGRSLREGYWRIYFSSGLERYAEFKEEDVLTSVKIPQEQPPFAGLEATRVRLKQEARMVYPQYPYAGPVGFAAMPAVRRPWPEYAGYLYGYQPGFAAMAYGPIL